MFQLEPGIAPGLAVIRPTVRRDDRGSFVKTVHASSFEVLGLRSDFVETYMSVSTRGVVRGMHFQTPTHQHAKIVYCLSGEVIDVALDLRRGSPTFGHCEGFRLDGAAATGVYLPEGFAHGFLTITDEALMSYSVTSEYAPEHDTGILWNSIPFDWGIAEANISERDKGFVALADFETPFVF